MNNPEFASNVGDHRFTSKLESYRLVAFDGRKVSSITTPNNPIGVGKVLNIGGGGWRGQGSEYWGWGGGVERARAGKLFAGCKLIVGPAPNQCQIITFLTLKTHKIAKLRIELKNILFEIPSNKLKGKSIKLVHL